MNTMKLFFVLLPLLTIGFASCRECNKCRKTAAPEVWLCNDDYPTSQEYQDAVARMESDGYDCDDYSN